MVLPSLLYSLDSLFVCVGLGLIAKKKIVLSVLEVRVEKVVAHGGAEHKALPVKAGAICHHSEFLAKGCVSL